MRLRFLKMALLFSVGVSGCGGGSGSTAASGQGGEQTADFGSVTASAQGSYGPPVVMGGRNSVVTAVYGAAFTNVIVRNPRIESLTDSQVLNLTDIAMDRAGTPAFYNYGTAQIRLFPGPQVYGNSSTPSISGSGTRVAYRRLDLVNNTFQIRTSNLDGTDEVQVTSASGGAAAPKFSPDGAWVLYTAYDAAVDRTRIYKVSATGGTPTVLSAATDNAVSPSWNQTGTQIAYFTQVNGLGSFISTSMSANGANVTALPGISNSDTYASSVAYLPRSSQMIATYHSNNVWYLWMFGPKGGYNMTSSGDGILSVSAAPAGNLIAYERSGPSAGIYVRNVLSNQEWKIADNSYTSPSWGPYLAARSVIGSGAILATTVGGFLFGQSYNGAVSSFLAIDAVTRSSIVVTKQTDANPNQPINVCIVSADSINNLRYLNDLRGGVTNVVTSASPVRGAVISYSADDGRVVSVIPYVQSAVVKKPGSLTFTGHFVSGFEKGVKRSVTSATTLVLNEKTGEIAELK